MAKAAATVRKPDEIVNPGIVMVGGGNSEDELEVEIGEGGDAVVEKPNKDVVARVALSDEERQQDDQELEEDARLAYDVGEGSDEYEQRGNSSRRARRNASRRNAIAGKDRTIADLTGKVDQLATQLEHITQGQRGMTVASVESELGRAQQALAMIRQERAKAVAEANGDRFAELEALHDEAAARVWQYGNYRQRLLQQQERGDPTNGGIDPATGRRVPQGNGKAATGPAMNQAAEPFIETFMSRFPSFDPEGSDEDSRLIKAIDDGVAADGYLAHTPMYWRTLEKRLAARGFTPEKRENGQNDQGGGDDQEDRQYERRATSRQENDSRQQGRPPISNPRGGNRQGTTGFRLHPEMRNYLESEGLLYDADLSDDQKNRRTRLINGWRTRSKEADRVAANRT